MNTRMKTLSAVLAIAALIGLITSGMTVSDVLAGKSYWEEKDIESTENINKLEDGLNELDENEQAYLDGRVKVADGEKTLEEGKKTLADGYAAYAQGKADYAKGKKDLAAGAKALAAGKKGVQQLKDGVAQLTAPTAYPTWRDGFEQIKDKGYVTNGNLDKQKAKNDKAMLEQAISAYGGVKGLEDNGATKKQAVEMVASSQEQSVANIQNLYDNYDNIVAVHAAVSSIEAIGSDQSAAEAFIFNTDAGDAGKDAYNYVKQALAAGAPDVDSAATMVVKSGAKDTVTEQVTEAVTAEVMAKVEAGEITEEDAEAVIASEVEARVPAALDAYVASDEGQQKVGQVKYAYNAVKDAVEGVLAVNGDHDAACAYVDNSKNLDAGTAAQLYEYKENGSADAVKTNVDRLQKPTSEGGITHSEAVAAVAYKVGVPASTVETAYSTVDGMGLEKAKANVKALENLTKDGGQMDQLKAGKKKLQSKLNTLVSKIKGNKDLRAKAEKAGIDLDKLTNMLNGSDQSFELAVDTIVQMAPGMVDAAQDAVDAGQAKYDEGKQKLEAGAAKLVAAEDALAQGERDLAAGEKELADGKAKLAEYEDGAEQAKDGIQQVVDTEPDGDLRSIADRLGPDYTYIKPGTDGELDIPQGFKAVNTAREYKAESGAAIEKEMYGRIYATVAALLASLLALVASALGFFKKYKGALPCAGIAAIAAAVAAIMANNAGMTFSSIAGSTMGHAALFAGVALAVIAAVHAAADGVAAKA